MAKNMYLKRRNWFLTFACCLLIFLGGCVRYDVGVNFDSQQNGAIVQYIKIGEQFTSFNQSEARKWLRSIEKRTKELQGSIQRISSQEIAVTIPFGNGKELVSKFNKFFNAGLSPQSKKLKAEGLDLVQLNAKMSLQQSNWLFFERDRLSLDADLRALGVLSSQGKLIVSPGSLVDLKFQLTTPWRGKIIQNENTNITDTQTVGKQITWQLIPGQINHLETVFWLPSPIGIGAFLIAVLMVAGFYLKYKRFPLVYQG